MQAKIPVGHVDHKSGTFTDTAEHLQVFGRMTLSQLLAGKRVDLANEAKAEILRFYIRTGRSGRAKPTGEQLVELCDTLKVPIEFGADIYKRLVKSIVAWATDNIRSDMFPALLQEDMSRAQHGNRASRWACRWRTGLPDTLRDASFEEIVSYEPKSTTGWSADWLEAEAKGDIKLLQDVMHHAVSTQKFLASTDTEVVFASPDTTTSPSRIAAVKQKIRVKRADLAGAQLTPPPVKSEADRLTDLERKIDDMTKLIENLTTHATRQSSP